MDKQISKSNFGSDHLSARLLLIPLFSRGVPSLPDHFKVVRLARRGVF